MQLFTNSAKGFVLGIVETRQSDGKVYKSAGPFQIDVTDPAGAIAVVPGSADQTTSTILRPNGSGKAGTVTVKVTDTSNNLVGSASFDVVAPPASVGGLTAVVTPVDLPDTLTVNFAPEA